MTHRCLFSAPSTVLTVLLFVAVADKIAAQNPIKRIMNENKVLDSQQLASQEGTAQALFDKGQGLEQSGRTKAARDTYRSVFKNYPRTQAASEAIFRSAVLREQTGDPKGAFDEYQELISNYRNARHFDQAVTRQFGIAENLRQSDKKGFLGLGAAVQPSKLIEMYELISDSAPYSEFAPRSLLNVGRVQTEIGSTIEAIIAYQNVVDAYPGTSFAAEAQFEIFKLRGKKAADSNSPVEDRAQVEAGLDFMTQNPNDERANKVRAGLNEIEERSMEKLYNTGAFYEKSGKLDAAKVYYRDVVRRPGSSWAGKARERLMAIDAAQAAGQTKTNMKTGSPRQKRSAQPEARSAGGGGILSKLPFRRKKATESLPPPPAAPIAPVPEAPPETTASAAAEAVTGS